MEPAAAKASGVDSWAIQNEGSAHNAFPLAGLEGRDGSNVLRQEPKSYG
jgi:hypothetical protein